MSCVSIYSHRPSRSHKITKNPDETLSRDSKLLHPLQTERKTDDAYPTVVGGSIDKGGWYNVEVLPLWWNRVTRVTGGCGEAVEEPLHTHSGGFTR